MSYLKAQTFRSEPYLAAVRALPCVACWREGRTQAAHRNQGKGAGLKTHDCWTAALCVECHGEIDQGSGLSREQRRERMDHYILLTQLELMLRGSLRIA